MPSIPTKSRECLIDDLENHVRLVEIDVDKWYRYYMDEVNLILEYKREIKRLKDECGLSVPGLDIKKDS